MMQCVCVGIRCQCVCVVLNIVTLICGHGSRFQYVDVLQMVGVKPDEGEGTNMSRLALGGR